MGNITKKESATMQGGKCNKAYKGGARKEVQQHKKESATMQEGKCNKYEKGSLTSGKKGGAI